MLAAQVVQTSIEDLKAITRVEMVVTGADGIEIASTSRDIRINAQQIADFAKSIADSQAIAGYHYLKVNDGDEIVYIIICKDANEDYTIAKIAVCQLQNLLVAYKEKFDRNSFFQNLILDNLLLVDIYNRAKKLHIENDVKRVIYLIQAKYDKDNGAMEMLKSLFSSHSGDFVTSVDEQSIILVKQLGAEAGYDEVNEVADTIVAMMNTEAMLNVSVAYGTIISELKEVSKSFKEAKMALNVGKIFYADRKVMAYNTLGIGRLIYQLPVNLCRMFIEEIFGGDIPEEVDEEILMTVNMFLDNNLNVSETARQLYVHRNTLLYRLEKLQKATGMDIRVFEDALTLKIALMVENYLKYLETHEYQ